MKISEPIVKALGQIITGDGQYGPLYRSGPMLVDFFNQFGQKDTYGQGFPSRWQYAEEKIREANGTSAITHLIEAAIDPRDYFESEVEVEETAQYLNGMLAFDGYQIVKNDLLYFVRPLDGSQGKKVKNLIFAANGPKPEIVLEDATTNDIRIVKNADYCLVYDCQISLDGLSWGELVDWWATRQDLTSLSRSEKRRNLYSRLYQSLDSIPEKAFFRMYFEQFLEIYEDNLPALIPQVYLHYDPYTLSHLKGRKRLSRQRMDFLLLLPKNKKVVIEIDGKQHYSLDNRAVPKLYAEMVSEDRRLKLAGYEVFRFGGYEFQDLDTFANVFSKFFANLFETHKLIAN